MFTQSKSLFRLCRFALNILHFQFAVFRFHPREHHLDRKRSQVWVFFALIRSFEFPAIHCRLSTFNRTKIRSSAFRWAPYFSFTFAILSLWICKRTKLNAIRCVQLAKSTSWCQLAATATTTRLNKIRLQLVSPYSVKAADATVFIEWIKVFRCSIVATVPTFHMATR